MITFSQIGRRTAMFGPILAREWLVAPRRLRFYVQRVVFIWALFSIVCTTWALLAGMQSVQDVGDMARFGVLVVQIVVPIELAVAMFLTAVAAVSNVAQEKDRRTLVLLLLTRLSNAQVVLGKLTASLLSPISLIFCSVPLLLMVTLMGGLSPQQVGLATAVMVVSSLWCGALANLIAFWRDKTFQSLAIAVLAVAGWLVLCEVLAAGAIPAVDSRWAELLSPFRSLRSVCQPISDYDWLQIPGGVAAGYCLLGMTAAGLFSLTAIARLRAWNPSDQVRPRQPDPDDDLTVDRAQLGTSVVTWKARAPRPMWHNPILWRETRTWAYGRKLVLIRLAYLAGFAIALVAISWSVTSGLALQRSRLAEELLPVAAKILVPFFVVSLVMLNALAVNSITNERDGQALDLLLTTNITPAQFMTGKILGVLYVGKEMVLLPGALACYLWWQAGISTSNLSLTLTGGFILNIFAVMLGIHCGMIYARSRTAIGTSLGTLFFLFLGIATCMMIMMSFRGSFARQLPPFLAIIVGGGTGLFVAMGSRNPSPAIALAAFALPFLTFFAITSFILRGQELTVFLVLAAAYGFATLAMLVPALSEFDFAMGRSRSVDDEE
ncbi:MAG: ABC transporter permease [Pirellulaceae bacterium]|nr:ABC transporter permease [Pirellulaceae bacterium]